jgi:hypothetical protein
MPPKKQRVVPPAKPLPAEGSGVADWGLSCAHTRLLRAVCAAVLALPPVGAGGTVSVLRMWPVHQLAVPVNWLCQAS